MNRHLPLCFAEDQQPVSITQGEACADTLRSHGYSVRASRILRFEGDASLTFLHTTLATSAVMFLIVAGIWGIVGGLRKQQITGNYWGILAVGALLLLVQGILGGLLWFGGERPGRLSVHLLYGVLDAISLPAYYAISKGRDDASASLLYGILCVFLAGISLRAIVTGY